MSGTSQANAIILSDIYKIHDFLNEANTIEIITVESGCISDTTLS